MDGNYNNGNPGGPEQAIERSALKHDANFIGMVSLVLTVLLNFVFSLIILALNAVGIVNTHIDNFGLGSVGFLIVYAAAYSIGMGSPAPVVAAIARRRIRPFANYLDGQGREQPLWAPSIILVLFAGLAMCVVANFVTSYILAILNQFDIKTPEMPSYLDKSVVSLLLNVIIFALLPAIFEEMVYRGYVLKTLRRYGDGLAILVSSLLFALMHGNILQIPFAFIVGLTCGFIVVRTGRIWPAMMLHFLNNLMSTLLNYAGLYTGSESRNQQMTLVVFALVGVLGLTSLLILLAVNDPIVQHFRPRAQVLTAGQKAGALLTSPAFLISLLLSLALTLHAAMEGVV